MTGLEQLDGNVVVQRYLTVTRQRIGHLMPGWPGWDEPHIMTSTGGILPTCSEMLTERAERFDRLRRWIRTTKRRR